MSREPKYTEAEKRSFKLLPATCDVIDADIDKASMVHTTEVVATLAKYGINDPSKNLLHAIDAIIGRVTFDLGYEAKKSFKYKGTFPLRLVIVRMIEQQMRDAGEHVQLPNNYEQWIQAHIDMEEVRRKNK